MDCILGNSMRCLYIVYTYIYILYVRLSKQFKGKQIDKGHQIVV